MQQLTNITEQDANLISIASKELESKNSEPLQTVVAAARTASGSIVTALNLYHFTGGPCAESVLMANNLYSGDDFETVVAVHYDEKNEIEVINPCGRCRQMFIDYQPDVRVLVDDSGAISDKPINALMPYSYQNKAIEYARIIPEEEVA